MIFLFSIALCNWLITCLIQTLSCIASAKLQILKAIHNGAWMLCVCGGVVLRVQSYKSFNKRSETIAPPRMFSQRNNPYCELLQNLCCKDKTYF